MRHEHDSRQGVCLFVSLVHPRSTLVLFAWHTCQKVGHKPNKTTHPPCNTQRMGFFSRKIWFLAPSEMSSNFFSLVRKPNCWMFVGSALLYSSSAKGWQQRGPAPRLGGLEQCVLFPPLFSPPKNVCHKTVCRTHDFPCGEIGIWVNTQP